jgi:hypothetical protein
MFVNTNALSSASDSLPRLQSPEQRFILGFLITSPLFAQDTILLGQLRILVLVLFLGTAVGLGSGILLLLLLHLLLIVLALTVGLVHFQVRGGKGDGGGRAAEHAESDWPEQIWK